MGPVEMTGWTPFSGMPHVDGVLAAIPFVHPSLAFTALAACGIPILIHLLNRRRFRRVPWAAMSFLLAASRRSAKRLRLEQWLLMAVRLGMVALFGLAVARPYLPAEWNGQVWRMAGLGGSRVHRVMVLDNSLSMNARLASNAGAASRFMAAKECALRLLESFPPTDSVSLVTMARPAEQIIAHASLDRRLVRERLAAMNATQRSPDTAGALTAALEILRSSDVPASNRALYVISDFPRTVWEPSTTDPLGDRGSSQSPGPHGLLVGGDTGGMPAPPGVLLGSPRKDRSTGEVIGLARRLSDELRESSAGVNFIHVGDAGVGNLAVADLSCESPMVGVDLPVRIGATLVNFSSQAVRRAEVQLRRDNEIIRREPSPLILPGESVRVDFATEFNSPGTHILEARLSVEGDNALSEDDVRSLSLEVKAATGVLIVDGRPGAKLLDGQAGYLATALDPRVPSSERAAAVPRPTSVGRRTVQRSLVNAKVIDVAELETEPLPSYDALMLCNVARLSAEQWNLVSRYVRDGGGLLVFMGDAVAVDNYNRFGFAGGQGVLPGELRRAVDFASLRGAEGSADAHGETVGRFAADELTHPLVAEFADRPDSGLFVARVPRYVPITVDPQRAEVPLRYSNGDAAWIASGHGSGRVLVCTTTANMEWNNLPAKGDYVSLMLNAVSFLRSRHGDRRNVLVGGALLEPLSPGETSLPLKVWTADAEPRDPALVPHGGGLAATFGPLDRAGVTTLQVGDGRRSFAANVVPSESDLAVVDWRRLSATFSRPPHWMEEGEIQSGQSEAAAASEMATLMLLAAGALLFAESWLAMQFGRPSAGRASGSDVGRGRRDEVVLARPP